MELGLEVVRLVKGVAIGGLYEPEMLGVVELEASQGQYDKMKRAAERKVKASMVVQKM